MEGNGCDYASIDNKRSAKRFKRKDPDIKAFENHSGGHTLKRSVEKPNIGILPKDENHVMFLKSLLSENEPSISLNKCRDYSDGKKDMDPQYKMFLENSREDGLSYKLEMTTKMETVSVMYKGKDISDDDCMQSLVNLKTFPTKTDAEKQENQDTENNTIGESDNVNVERNSKPEVTNNKSLSPSRDTRICNNMMDSTKNIKNKIGEVQNFVEENLKSRGVNDLKNIPRKKVKTRNISKNDTCKHVENTSMYMKNNRGKEKRKTAKEKKMKSKLPKTDEFSGKISGAEWSDILGSDCQHELNADGVDECYRIFLSTAKIEGDCAIYAVEGQKLVKQEAPDVVCSYDSEVLVTSNSLELNEEGHDPFQTRKHSPTPENVQCLRSHGGGFASVFRTKLMDKLGEAYDERECRKLWNEFNKERPKVKHFDLRGPGAVKSFPVGELSPSYHDTYALLSRKIDAAGNDHLQRLKYLRGFFFWLQNVAYEDAFEPWLDKSCLEVMQKI